MDVGMEFGGQGGRAVTVDGGQARGVKTRQSEKLGDDNASFPKPFPVMRLHLEEPEFKWPIKI